MAMTIEEKRNAIEEHCDRLPYCKHEGYTCPLYNIEDLNELCYEGASDETIIRNYELIFGKEPTDTPNDIINHPSHYCRDGGMESIDEMVLVFGKEAVKNFCLCNVWKYRYRSSTKNGEEDLKKSDWYMRKYKELSNE